MRPVPPGWVIVPVREEATNEWWHLVGWTEDMQPVVAWTTGIQVWRNVCGTDAYCVATLEEWTGAKCNT